MPLTDIEKDRVRWHLGYPATLTVSSMSFGLPAPLETLFLVNTAVEIIKEGWPIQKIREILDEMDCILRQISDSRRRFAAESLDSMKLRSIENGKTEADALRREYAWYGTQLCDILRVPFYPYSERFASATGVMAGSIPVRH